MASPVKKSKGKRRREADLLPKEPETETQPSSPKKRLTDKPTNSTETRNESSPKKNQRTKPKTKKQPQIPPQHITDAPKTPRTPAAAEQLGLDSDVAWQLLKNGEDLSSLTAMIWEAGKMIVEHGIPDTDAKYKSLLAEFVKNMVTLPFFPLVVPKSLLTARIH